MNIIIPLGGKGERFLKEGYSQPKALIPVFDKTMIETVIDHIHYTKDDSIFIIYNKILDNHNFNALIKSKYPSFNLIPLEYETLGAAETVSIGIDTILKNDKHHTKTILFDCDTFYTTDLVQTFRTIQSNMVFYRQDTNTKPLYSYIALDEHNHITQIAEKDKISHNANTGCYAFQNIHDLYTYCKKVVDERIYANNEPYISCVIGEMMKDGHLFVGSEIPKHNLYSLGTPTELKTYLDNTHAFLFDLDGTLVLTDTIYFEVWKTLLHIYEITLTKHIFETYIQGNNDSYVINSLLKNINVNVADFSNKKDAIFLENIEKLRIVNGMHDLLANIYAHGHKISIVTNCNRIAAEKIIQKIGICKYVDFIVTSNDCENPKPSPEPYLCAIQRYNIDNSKAFVFEDSNTGILSGKSIQPKCLIGITTLYTKDELVDSGVDVAIDDYVGFDIHKLIHNENMYLEKMKQCIINSLPFEITKVEIDSTKLKGGFIADVVSLKLTTPNGIRHCVLKIENKNTSALSTMATDLDLYNREYVFYEDVSKYCNVHVPEFYGIIRDANGNNIGLLLQNMFYYGDYKINVNLNVENIDVSLKIISRMAKFHSLFWKKNKKQLFPRLKHILDPIFCPTWTNYIHDKWELFMVKWSHILTTTQIAKCKTIVNDFSSIQQRLATGNSTIVHGDIKSPNIMYDMKGDYEPCFLDWQHIVIGKGVQDLVFFMIESFDITSIDLYFPIFKNYYYTKLREYGIIDYLFADYERDLQDAICYVPVFTAIWFGTLPYDDLIDKNFPFFFIQKLFHMIDKYT